MCENWSKIIKKVREMVENWIKNELKLTKDIKNVENG